MADNKTRGSNGRTSNRKSSRGGGRRGSGGLRRFANVESVMVEEPFTFSFPSSSSSSTTFDSSTACSSGPTPVASSSSTGVGTATASNNETKVGEGCYVSATVQNKRYYGVLVDQASLKEASLLWFQDQAASLDLNRRMKVLLPDQLRQTSDDTKLSTVDLSNQKRKFDDRGGASQEEPKRTKPTTSLQEPTKTLDTLNQNDQSASGSDSFRNDQNTILPSSSKPDSDHGNEVQKLQQNQSDQNDQSEEVIVRLQEQNRPVQKFSYVPQSHKTVHDALASKRATDVASDYRVLVATFCNIMAAADDDVDKAIAIEKACDEGGDFVGKYYYQYEVLGTTLRATKPPKSTLKGSSTSALSGDADSNEMRMSMGLHSFLSQTTLPAWFPLSNLQFGASRSKFLGMLNMKQDNSGNVVYDVQSVADATAKTAGMDITDSRAGGGSDPKSTIATSMLLGGTRLTMQPRPTPRFQIGVIGGGIAGLACCQELIRQLDTLSPPINYQVVLLEGRSRLGGRLWTDRTTFRFDNHCTRGSEASSSTETTDSKARSSKFIPVDLGASWIHGIDDNPLAALAKEADIDFITTSEEVRMVGKNMEPVDTKLDEKMGKLFDKLLDLAADDCWAAPEETRPLVPPNLVQDSQNLIDGKNEQASVRWYSSIFREGFEDLEKSTKNSKERVPLEITETPLHRLSSDRSIDVEIGKAIVKHKLGEFSKMSAMEHRMLLWNTKNVEYALGANLNDLSMKYWDSDERHAFEGDHVLLKQGYSTVVEHMIMSLLKAGNDKFRYFLNFPVGQVEYARKSTTCQHPRQPGWEQKLEELSDACSVTSQDGQETKYFDFLVCAVPLGVLKESIAASKSKVTTSSGSNNPAQVLSFHPQLPFSKVDAITNVGFGLLDKIYLQFPIPFWRTPNMFSEDDQCLFGNASGINPHFYMFFDVGRSLGRRLSPTDSSDENPPAILMTLVSGKEAVDCEHLNDADLIDHIMTTLRGIFEGRVPSVPQPTAYQITRWGKDKFSRGSYTFLPPGATDQDFQLLQSSINGNGDSLLLEGSETMRLFFAGEHTTALHPSMAHGALLSGIRAAQEVIDTMRLSPREDRDIDRVVPVALFRHKNPDSPLQCSLCHKIGGQVREGTLLCFKRGARQVLVHNNCAEYSPEVEVADAKWKYVIKAVNRSKSLECSLCSKPGATIGCTSENCYRVFHFSCSEDTGWRFDRDGKVFFCDMHRQVSANHHLTSIAGSTAPGQSRAIIKDGGCDRISIRFFLTKNPASSLFCALCGGRQYPKDERASELWRGELLAFQSGLRQACVHEKCAKFTTIVDTAEVEESRMGHDHRNIFSAIDRAKQCSKCGFRGATIGCSYPSCNQCFHFGCAVSSSEWNFDKRGAQRFRCHVHLNMSQEQQRNKSQVPMQSSNIANDVGGMGNPFQLKAVNHHMQAPSPFSPGLFQHNLLASFGAMPKAPSSRIDMPSNSDFGGKPILGELSQSFPSSNNPADNDHISISSDDDFSDDEPEGIADAGIDTILSENVISGSKRLVRVRRSSREKPWNVTLKATAQISGNKKRVNGNRDFVLEVDHCSCPKGEDALHPGDVIISMNGIKVGSEELKTLRLVLFRLKQEVDLMVEVVSADSLVP